MLILLTPAGFEGWFKELSVPAPAMTLPPAIEVAYEVRLRLSLKYKREHLAALQLEKFMTSILARIDLERTASTKKLKADVAERPGYNELGDPRTVETERGETQWSR